jgi:hypothetical protein
MMKILTASVVLHNICHFTFVYEKFKTLSFFVIVY